MAVHKDECGSGVSIETIGTGKQPSEPGHVVSLLHFGPMALNVPDGRWHMLPYGGPGIMVPHRGSASESDAIRAKALPPALSPGHRKPVCLVPDVSQMGPHI